MSIYKRLFYPKYLRHQVNSFKFTQIYNGVEKVKTSMTWQHVKAWRCADSGASSRPDATPASTTLFIQEILFLDLRIFVLNDKIMAERPFTRPKQGDERAHHRRPPLLATVPMHPRTWASTSRIGPCPQSIHARHSSSNKQRVTCAVVATRLKTLAFPHDRHDQGVSCFPVCLSESPDRQRTPLPNFSLVRRHYGRQLKPWNRPQPNRRSVGALEGEVIESLRARSAEGHSRNTSKHTPTPRHFQVAHEIPPKDTTMYWNY
jgi:hypothetical protein